MKHRQLLSGAAAVAALCLGGCGGGGGSTSSPPPPPPPPATYTAVSGVAQKGPLILGSAVTAQELDASLNPTGKQYSYQTTSNLGTFNPNSTFTSQYIGVNATGYYFDEVANAVSGATITLNGYSDLSAVSVLNVNLLTTLAFQRIQNLVTKNSMTFGAAEAQAESEVLAAFDIHNPIGFGRFSSFDLSKSADGDYILATLSSIFVYGNTSGNLSTLIAQVQSDIGANGAITNAATKAALLNSAQAVNPGAVAANLSNEYASSGIVFKAKNISDWLDTDGDGLTGKFKFNSVRSPQASTLAFPTSVTDPYAGMSLSLSTGQLYLNGAPVTGPITPVSGDVIGVGPPAGFSTGVATAYLSNGTTKVGRASFYGHGAWSAAADMNIPRPGGFAAVLLANGKVLVSGGCDPSRSQQCIATDSEIYDPATDSWSTAAADPAVRDYATATVLTAGPNAGKVLVAGGSVYVSGSYDNTAALSAELYDPIANSWSLAGSLSTARSFHTATVLANGDVMVAGGQGPQTGVPIASCEIYNAVTNSWSTAASLASARSGHNAALLGNGKVLVVSGNSGANGLTPSTAAELYDPTLNAWSGAGTVITPRTQGTASLLVNGKVLVSGGINLQGVSLTELYDPAANSWSAGPALPVPAAGTAVTLAGGDVLLLGSSSDALDILAPPTWNPQLYDPIANSWTSAVGSYAPKQAGYAYQLAAFQFANGVVFSIGALSLGNLNLLYWR
jgi:hypothetical protein